MQYRVPIVVSKLQGASESQLGQKFLSVARKYIYDVTTFLFFRNSFSNSQNSYFFSCRVGANCQIQAQSYFHEQIMTKIIDFPIPEAGKSPNIGYFDLT